LSIVLLILKGLLSAAFLLAGGAKLAGAKPLADQFREFGLPAWTMPLVGALEVAGASGLWLEPFAGWAALGLAGLMLGALANHAKARHPISKFAPAAVLLLLCLLSAGGTFQSNH
jgi:uncharacterized membrane protein YphA (DoxX/SURF4 family)